MKSKVNVAVIGAGYWGKKVISEYLQLARKDDEVNLSMVCDLQDENLRYCREVLDLPERSLSKDYEKALRSKSINAVHICTPNETHYHICREALTAGKHALLEKPMAQHAKQAWELVSTAKDRGLILQVGHIFRFDNALRMMRDLIARNYLGDLYYLKLQWTTLMSSPLNRDIVYDLGPHPIDILNYLLDRWPVRVTCKAEAYRRELLEELAYITMEFDNKLIAHIELSWLQPGKTREISVVGSERTAIVDCVDQSIGIHENGDGESFRLDVDRNNTILDETSHFAHSVMMNKNGRNPGDIGAKNVAILECLKRSQEENRTIKVTLQD